MVGGRETIAGAGGIWNTTKESEAQGRVVIRFDHKHPDGTDCFTVRNRMGTYDPIYISMIIDQETFRARKVIVAYLNYSSCWYVFDYISGDDIATLRSRDNPIARNLVYNASAQLKTSYGDGPCQQV